MVETLKDEALREIRVRAIRVGGALGVKMAMFSELPSTPWKGLTLTKALVILCKIKRQ